VSKVFLALGIGFVYFFLIFLNYGGQILSNLVGFIFPGTFPLQRRLIAAYESIKAIESVGTADDTQWLTYWVVFSFFNVVEYWSRTILYWLRMFPGPMGYGLANLGLAFYYLFKTIIVLWLALPQFRGAQYIYHAFLRPLLARHIAPAPGFASPEHV
jgi:receptor expression-enhancing protein 5/6